MCLPCRSISVTQSWSAPTYTCRPPLSCSPTSLHAVNRRRGRSDDDCARYSCSAFLRKRLPLERRASERTCETYALALRLFFEFTARELRMRPSSLRLEHLDAPRVQAFLEHLEKQRHNSPGTRNVRLAAIRTFMRFIEMRIIMRSGERYS